jgi:hypothetical protein
MTAQLTQVWTVLEDVTTGTLPLFSSPSHAKKRPHRLTIRPSRISSTIPTTPRTPPTPNQKMSVSFVLIAQTPTFVSVKHERRDGLTERRATQRASLRCVALRSVIAPSVWPCHRPQNHLNCENLGFPRSSPESLPGHNAGRPKEGGGGKEKHAEVTSSSMVHAGVAERPCPARHVGSHARVTKLRRGSDQRVQMKTCGTLSNVHVPAKENTWFSAERGPRWTTLLGGATCSSNVRGSLRAWSDKL